MDHNIKHLAIIMDGNARWAQLNGLTKAEGHKKGAEVAKDIFKVAEKLHVRYLTLYTFSSENWRRPEDEVSTLIKLLAYYVKTEFKTLKKSGIRLKVIGDLERLPLDLKLQINNAVKDTAQNSGFTLCLAFGYGARAEIVDACKKIINSGISEIAEEHFHQYLYDPEMPDVDLLIRTGGDLRISNFLLWHAAYAELYFLDKYWPDFTEEDLMVAMDNYNQRIRNFGARII